jgi:hypothetical protein
MAVCNQERNGERKGEIERDRETQKNEREKNLYCSILSNPVE